MNYNLLGQNKNIHKGHHPEEYSFIDVSIFVFLLSNENLQRAKT